jgi:ABC-type Mn2+/Zn2+ transport system ATPase subunit
MVAICGPNGAGKTTLLKAIAGTLPSDRDSIKWRGAPIPANRSFISYIPQKKDMDPGFPLTIRSWVETGRYSHTGLFRSLKKEDHAAVQHALELTRISNISNQSINTLSGGQMQRAYIARAIAQEAQLVLMDEPLEGLDEQSREDVLLSMRNLVDNGALILASLHNQSICQLSFSYCAWIENQHIRLTSNHSDCSHHKHSHNHP